MPILKERFGCDSLNLLAKPVHVDSHHRIVRFICRTTKRILHEDDPEAPVDCSQCRAQDANVRLAPGYDNGIDSCTLPVQGE